MNAKAWKKAALAVLALCLSGAAKAAVGTPSNLNIDVAITASLSVSVNGVQSSTYSGVNWNTSNANQELVAASSTTVVNDSNVVEKWALSTNVKSINTLGNPAQWTLKTSTSPALPSADEFAVQAVFGSSNTASGGCPGVGAATWNNGPMAPPLTTAQQLYTSTRFADTSLTTGGGLATPDVTATGSMLAAGKRVLCWRIVTPSATTTTETQNIQLIVTAL